MSSSLQDNEIYSKQSRDLISFLCFSGSKLKVILQLKKILTKLYELKNINFERKDNQDFAYILDRYIK